MEKEKLSILKAEINYQTTEIEKIIQKIEDRKKENMEDEKILESLAYQLHNLYCAFEDLFKIIARFFENNIEDPSRYHIELLNRMTLDIEGVRPQLLSKELAHSLDDLRAFRHFFRHAYTYEIDRKKIDLLLEKVNFLKSNYGKEIESFLKKLL